MAFTAEVHFAVYKMKVQLATMIIVDAILLAVVIPVFIGKYAEKMHQTLVLTGTIAKGMAGGSVNLAATLRKVNWGRRAWFMSLLFLELFRTICSWC